MTNTATIRESLLDLFNAPGPRGIVDLADDLVHFCAENQVSLTITPNECSYLDLTHKQKGSFPFTMQKNIFRALLARISVLCKESNTITPYGGTGQIKCTTNPFVIRTMILNTPDQLLLEMFPLAIA